ncbi:efflux RND transporter permease subunit [Aquibacillus koreensis]|uniref:Efflux RND transporter permease subunit n=1 Tax=Aquibacillus koreensis TaxID=279446 RepID=A0A9X4AJG8_9BACI|nr:efflux RND transporter permease subunit [Aquibacillus koreensis]MCT2534472.1 efflux RND transporter permease subunit [Aquibacillus koreensis]MDC3421779.1 efflux RND transporter permease subunit [Aquibacillus koreensis]
MNLIKFIVQRKILVGLMVVLVFFVGSFAIMKLDKELMPSITFDGAYVNIDAGEMSAIEVERNITNPLEKQILGIDGVEGVQSVSNIGVSSMNITLASGQGDAIFKDIESLVLASTSNMTGIKDVQTDQVSMDSSYEFFMDVSGGEMEEMTAFAKDILEPRLEELPEVRDVMLGGLLEHEMAVEFDRDEISERGLDVMQVMSVIQQANSEATLGEVQENKDTASVRWNTKLTSVDDVESIKIPTATGHITLDEIANVSLKPLEASSFVWKDGSKDLVFVQIGRTSDVTQIELATAVRAEIENIRDDGLVSNFELNEMVAQADYVEDAINGVTSNILIGAVIAVVILLLFLRNVRATIIVGLSIPTSVLLTFTAMWLFDYSFNMLSLIGLGLGIGMMVDSSIVILESIYRKKEQGLNNLQAVTQGTKEVATAVIASMLTTIVVFLPIGMIGGEVGQFMIILSVIVAATLISSVIISFSLIPALSDKFLRVNNKKKKAQKQGKLVKGYNRIVSWVVRKKRYSLAVVGSFVLIFVGSMFFVTKIPMTIMPDVLNRYNEILIDVETGLTANDKEDLALRINEELSSIQDVTSNYVMDNGDVLYAVINMTKGDDVTRDQDDVNEEVFRTLRDLQDEYPVDGVHSAMNGGGGSPVQINIKGEDFTELQNVTDSFTGKLSSIDGIVGITNSMERTSAEQIIELNQAEIDEAGLSELQIKQYVEQAFLNTPVGEMTVDDENVPLSIRWDQQTVTKEDLLDIEVPTAQGLEPLSTFIELTTVETPNSITHVDGERYISVSADIEGKDLGTINREVQQLINDFESETPQGYTVAAAGDIEQQQELMQEMLIVLGLAIFLVYLVMAVQFNHLVHPIVVMSVIPMTIVGVIIGLFLTQQELSMMSGMGIIMLIGIVLNNAILLIDRTNQLRSKGLTVPAALVQAGSDRIRPIFMTTLTTVGGMLPLALASGSAGNYQAPMATAIISGLLFATFITLLLIPAVYRLFSKKEKQQQPEEKKIENIEQLPAKSISL